MWVYYITIGIIVAGLIISSILFFRAFKESKSIQHYQAIRDALTLKKKKKPVEEIKLETETPLEESSGGGGFIGSLIGAFVTIMIGASLIGPVTEQVNQTLSTNAQNSSTMTYTMLKMLPFFFAFIVLAMGIAIAASALRRSGLL